MRNNDIKLNVLAFNVASKFAQFGKTGLKFEFAPLVDE